MKKLTILIVFILLIWGVKCHAADWYVRTDGSNNRTSCDGHHDAAAAGAVDGPDADSLPDCAYNHIFWVLPPRVAIDSSADSIQMASGDTLYIMDGSYKIGPGAPNTGSCYTGSACYPKVPDNVRILGEGWDTGCYASTNAAGFASPNPVVELWGSNRQKYVLYVTNADDTEINCLEITDHAMTTLCSGGFNPLYRYDSSNYSLENAESGIGGTFTTNLSLKNIYVHGITQYGLVVGGTSLTAENLKIMGNRGGWEMWYDEETGNHDKFEGDWVLTNVEIGYSGCLENYPKGSGYTYSLCADQSQCGDIGDGFGESCDRVAPNFTSLYALDFTCDQCYMHHNVFDGLDLLYNKDDGNSFTILRSRFEGNGGNQLKIRTPRDNPAPADGDGAWIENSILIGNCNYARDAGIACMRSTGCDYDYSPCRAGGNTFPLTPARTGSDMWFYNNTMWGEGMTSLFENEAQLSCGDNTQIFANNIYYHAYRYHEAIRTNHYNRASSSCSYPTETNSVSYHCEDSSCPSGTTIYTTDPDFNDTHNLDYGFNSSYYDLTLGSSSSALNKGDETVPLQEEVDFTNTSRGTAWDIGAYEFGSETPPSCVDDCTVCDRSDTCEAQSCYWVPPSTCQTTDPCTQNVTYCLTPEACEDNDGYWYDSQCNSATGCYGSVDLCTNEEDCEYYGGYWQDGDCKIDLPAINKITASGGCSAAGSDWE